MRLNTSADGSFQIGVVPRPGYLVVRAPSDDYVRQSIGTRMLDDGQPGGRLEYADGFSFLDLKPGLGSQEVNLVLRRGVTVTGGWSGRTASRCPTPGCSAEDPRTARRPLIRAWSGGAHGITHDGRFELHGLDPNAEVLVSFLEPKRKLGATVHAPGQIGSRRTDHRQARALRRRQGAAGRIPAASPLGGPHATDPDPMVRHAVVLPRCNERKDGSLMADQAVLQVIDPINYPKDETSDAEGRIVVARR